MHPQSTPGGPKPRPLGQRFWEKVLRVGADDCWLWQAAVVPTTGYGAFQARINGKRQAYGAHRIAYMLTYGPLDRETVVCHSCDIRYPPGDRTYRRCCNPTHLFAGTTTDNIQDMLAKGRRSGEFAPHAKLTCEQVIDIRQRHAQGEGYVRLSRAFGVNQSSIKKIVRGMTWQHLMARPRA